jgi:hypothetical protein
MFLLEFNYCDLLLLQKDKMVRLLYDFCIIYELA